MHSTLRFLSTTFLIPLLVLLLLTPSLIAAQVAGKKVALVIGNGDYSDMPPLKNPVNDAQDIAAVLQRLGFEVMPLYNANRKEIDRAIGAFRKALSQDRQNEGFFYYAGHGVQANGVNFLIPVGAEIGTEADLEDEAVSLQRVLGNIEDAGNKVNIIVLDACRNNPLPAVARSAERGLAVVATAPPESIVLYSTAANEVALDGNGRNSPFAQALIDHMADPGDIGTTIRAVTAEVKSLTGGKQTPFQYSSLDFSLYLNPESATASASAQPHPTLPAPAAPATPKITITRAYGSLQITAISAGSLYIDGAKIADLPDAASAKLDSVVVGERDVELHYADGQVDSHTVTVEAGRTARVSFTYHKAPPSVASVAQSSIYESHGEHGGYYRWSDDWAIPSAGKGVVLFKANAQNDITVAISPVKQVTKPMYEIVLGGWGNGGSAIRRESQGGILARLKLMLCFSFDLILAQVWSARLSILAPTSDKKIFPLEIQHFLPLWFSHKRVFHSQLQNQSEAAESITASVSI